MKQEEQQIKIAEFLGWKVDKRCYGSRIFALWGDSPKPPHMYEKVPDFINDLNAMHEAEKHLMDHANAWEDYCILLRRGYARPDGAIGSTAAQRAEAFLKTLNLWKNEN